MPWANRRRSRHRDRPSHRCNGGLPIKTSGSSRVCQPGPTEFHAVRKAAAFIIDPPFRPPEPVSYDVLILGSGLAGMSAALRLAERFRVALVTKHELLDGASSWAQGGIAAVMEETDSVENHIRDTHVAGAGLCHDDAV